MPKLRKRITRDFTIISNTALWAEESNGYMSVEELDEIVQMIVRAICSRKKTEHICGQEFPRQCQQLKRYWHLPRIKTK